MSGQQLSSLAFAPSQKGSWERTSPNDFKLSYSQSLPPIPANLDGFVKSTVRTPAITINPPRQAELSLHTQLFDARVRLKVASAQYAMHLSSEDRHRLFEELDYLLDADAWDEGDVLPRHQSFLGFLRWTIYAHNSAWTSMGLDRDGTILLAWKRGQNILTANFMDANQAKWSAQLLVGGDKEVSVGQGSLKSFAEHANFHLQRFG